MSHNSICCCAECMARKLASGAPAEALHKATEVTDEDLAELGAAMDAAECAPDEQSEAPLAAVVVEMPE